MHLLAPVLVFLLAFSGSNSIALAHRVNVFAYVDADMIRAECAFSNGQKVKSGKITVVDDQTNTVLVEDSTDALGNFSWTIPSEVRQAGHDLRIRINAGEGHQNEWIVPASDLEVSTAGTSTQETAPVLDDTRPAPAPAQTTTLLTESDIQHIVDRSLQTQLAPIKHMLAQQFNAGPKMTEIIGGLGWIFGIVGVATYFRRRR